MLTFEWWHIRTSQQGLAKKNAALTRTPKAFSFFFLKVVLKRKETLGQCRLFQVWFCSTQTYTSQKGKKIRPYIKWALKPVLSFELSNVFWIVPKYNLTSKVDIQNNKVIHNSMCTVFGRARRSAREVTLHKAQTQPSLDFDTWLQLLKRVGVMISYPKQSWAEFKSRKYMLHFIWRSHGLATNPGCHRVIWTGLWCARYLGISCLCWSWG